jgi:peptidoglycan/xylan/chitin deacetylase (PgdA/CDA1 family)
VFRRLSPITAAAIALLFPDLGGGSDVSRASTRPAEPAAADRSAAVDPPAATVPPHGEGDGDGTVTYAAEPPRSPGHGARVAFFPTLPTLPTSPTSASREPTDTTLTRELLLSFDDGPDLKGTPLILEELDRRGLKAIFFVTGWRLTGDRPEEIARRDLVRKIASHGHLVANHTMTHKNLCRNPTEAAAEIDDASEIVAQATGVRPLLFRAPYGAYCRSLAATLAARDLPDVGWNIDPQDWRGKDERGLLDYLTGKLARLEGRGILLLHDTHAASVNILPKLLDWIARENVRAVAAATAPITIIDYAALLPDRPLARSGLETMVARLASAAGESVSRLRGP